MGGFARRIKFSVGLGEFLFSGLNELVVIKIVGLLAFLLYLAFRLVRRIILFRTVNINVILASVAGYLIIGMLGGLSFQTLEVAIPGSFTPITPDNGLYDLVYLSFVTLTTLGYGDITPTNEAAKSLTVLLSIIGQLYLTILIAILIGKFLAKPNGKPQS